MKIKNILDFELGILLEIGILIFGFIKFMSLDSLEKKLYDPDSGIEKRKHEESPFDPSISAQSNADVLKKEKTWKEVEDTGKAKRIKILKIGATIVGGFILVALLTVGFVKFRQSAFKEEKVSIKIEGPDKIGSLEEAKYKIIFKNDNRAELKNAQLMLNYSENFKIKESPDLVIENPSNSRVSLGNIKSHSQKEVEISGVFFGVKDTIIYLNATLQYAPSAFNSVFQAKNQLGVNVYSSALFLEIQAPAETVSGDNVDYVINFKNSSSESFKGIRLKAEYPEGFSFTSSDPAYSEGNNIWQLGDLQPDQSGKIIISGKLTGLEGEGKNIKIYLGYLGANDEFILYNQEEKLIRITSTFLSIFQSISGKDNLNVNAGDFLTYVIRYKNNGDITLKDAIVTEEIESQVLDFSKLELPEGGSYNASRKTITWRAAEISGLSNLAPGEEGEINFSIPVLDRIPVKNSDDKNFIIVSVAKIDSPSLPTPIGSNKVVASNRIELKLNSKVVFEVKGYHKDAAQENFGPIPPKVGQETSYTIHWKIFNVSNDISGVKVVSSLPSGVKWLGNINPSQEVISFNERTNQIEWEMGNLKNGTGILDSAKEVSFQISAIPQINQLEKGIVLLNSSILTAKDSFTGSDIKIELEEKNNMLPEDSSLVGKYKVEE